MESTTAGKLTEGARVLVTTGPHSPAAFASDPAEGRAAEVLAEPEKVGRRRLVRTDLGDVEAGPTAKVLLAPPADAASELLDAIYATRTDVCGPPTGTQPAEAAPSPEDAVPPPAGVTVATATVNAAGRLSADSFVTVDDRQARVPLSTEEFGILAPARLKSALAELGYEPLTRWTAEYEAGTVTCHVRPAA